MTSIQVRVERYYILRTIIGLKAIFSETFTMDDVVRLLIRFVARGFYGKSYVLILDAVILHSVLSEDDLSHLLGIQRKELRALCNKLCEDRLLTVHTQKEAGNQFRPISRTYYYIHYTEAIDSIKWKVHSVVQSIKDDLHADSNPQGYICPVCKTRYSQLDAVSLLNYEKNEFLCQLCNEVLIEDDTGKIAKENQIKYSKLMKQLEPLIGYLRRIDEQPIPENNFESSLAKVIPVQAVSNATYTVSNIGKGSKMFDKDSYLNNRSSIRAGSKSQATLHVTITNKDETSQREQRAVEQEEKRKQNALPTWHEQSTVGSKSLGRLDKDEDGDIYIDSNGVKTEGEAVSEELANSSEINTENHSNPLADTEPVKPVQNVSATEEDKEAQDALAAYYEQLAQKAKEEDEEEEQEDEEDEDEDDDVEFDDVDFDDIAPSQPSTENKTANDLVVEEMDFPDSDEE